MDLLDLFEDAQILDLKDQANILKKINPCQVTIYNDKGRLWISCMNLDVGQFILPIGREDRRIDSFKQVSFFSKERMNFSNMEKFIEDLLEQGEIEPMDLPKMPPENGHVMEVPVDLLKVALPFVSDDEARSNLCRPFIHPDPADPTRSLVGGSNGHLMVATRNVEITPPQKSTPLLGFAVNLTRSSSLKFTTRELGDHYVEDGNIVCRYRGESAIDTRHVIPPFLISPEPLGGTLDVDAMNQVLDFMSKNAAKAPKSGPPIIVLRYGAKPTLMFKVHTPLGALEGTEVYGESVLVQGATTYAEISVDYDYFSNVIRRAFDLKSKAPIEVQIEDFSLCLRQGSRIAIIMGRKA